MSRPSQTESGYVQTFVRSKFFVRSSCVRRQICPDHPRPKQYMSRLSCVLVQTIVHSFFVRSKTNMSRPSQTETVYVQTFVRPCPDHRAVMSRPPCVQIQTIVRSCPDFHAFTRPKKKLHPGVQCYSLKMKTERVPKFHKSICLRFMKKFDFKSLFL